MIVLTERRNMKREISFCETFKPSYNYFDRKAESNNANEIKALILVQTDLVRDVLTDRQREAILLTVCDGLTLSAAARQMGISDCSVCRARQSGLDKLRKCISFCKRAIQYYQMEEHRNE